VFAYWTTRTAEFVLFSVLVLFHGGLRRKNTTECAINLTVIRASAVNNSLPFGNAAAQGF
jgi:hypothetical protein